MKAKELKIGNWVNHKWVKTRNDKWEEKQIVPNDIPACVKYPDTYEPIPLTEKWLIKFGFIHDETSYWLEKNNISICKDTFRVVRNTYFDEDIIYNAVCENVKYVHQLQNLYFALTNEELTIKE